MKKEVKFSLVYRDMWQSSGKYVPRKDQLEQIAPLIIDMGCFDRVETNGGAAEQVNLLYGENPNPSVRAFTAALHKGGIECHMLDRALNALRMNPVPADVRQLMYKVKKAQGVDITRIFCGLNDVRNIIPSIKWANEAGMISQAAMSITHHGWCGSPRQLGPHRRAYQETTSGNQGAIPRPHHAGPLDGLGA